MNRGLSGVLYWVLLGTAVLVVLGTLMLVEQLFGRVVHMWAKILALGSALVLLLYAHRFDRKGDTPTLLLVFLELFIAYLLFEAIRDLP